VTVLQPKIAKKFTKNPYFGGSRSFKVIGVGSYGKLVSSACYDKQQVSVYLQPFSPPTDFSALKNAQATTPIQ